MTVAVHRIIVRCRRIAAGIGIAGKVLTADDTGGGEVRIRRYRAVVGLIVGQQSGPAKGGVLVVHSGIDDANTNVLAGHAKRLRPAQAVSAPMNGTLVDTDGISGLDQVHLLDARQLAQLLDGIWISTTYASPLTALVAR